jgi:hypothetical protein
MDVGGEQLRHAILQSDWTSPASSIWPFLTTQHSEINDGGNKDPKRMYCTSSTHLLNSGVEASSPETQSARRRPTRQPFQPSRFSCKAVQCPVSFPRSHLPP